MGCAGNCSCHYSFMKLFHSWQLDWSVNYTTNSEVHFTNFESFHKSASFFNSCRSSSDRMVAQGNVALAWGLVVGAGLATAVGKLIWKNDDEWVLLVGLSLCTLHPCYNYHAIPSTFFAPTPKFPNPPLNRPFAPLSKPTLSPTFFFLSQVRPLSSVSM